MKYNNGHKSNLIYRLEQRLVKIKKYPAIRKEDLTKAIKEE